MSTGNNILPPLPPRPVVEYMQRRVEEIIKDPNNNNMGLIRATLEILADNPGLARTDAAWRAAFPDIDPIICTAAKTRTASHIVVDCLKRGSSPMARNSEGTPALHTLVSHYFDEETFKAMKLALEHPDCATLDALDAKGRIALQLAEGLVNKGNLDEHKEDARSIFKTLVERTPRELLREKMSLLPFFRSGFVSCGPDDSVFIARLLADCGVDLDKIHITASGVHHPLRELVENDHYEAAAGLLAAGLNESRICKRDCTTSQYLAGVYAHISRTNGKQIRSEAEKILKEHANELITGKITPREALISPYGCANWQAQGLLMQGMLMPLFGKKHAALFGGREQQLAFAGELDALFPPHQEGYFNLAVLLRDEPLARPSDSVTVGYLRGGSADVRKEGVA